MAQSAPVIFQLKRRLESAPDARAAGLRVWFDKDDLRPGTSWSAQIAQAIQSQPTAFVVYVGSGHGVLFVPVHSSAMATGKQRPGEDPIECLAYF
jgi:hypothetical protein